MSVNRYRRRLLVNRFNLAMSLGTMAFGMLFLFWILAVLVQNGYAALSPTLFTATTPPPGSSGGLSNAIVGSMLIVGTATGISTPILAQEILIVAEADRRNAFPVARCATWGLDRADDGDVDSLHHALKAGSEVSHHLGHHLQGLQPRCPPAGAPE